MEEWVCAEPGEEEEGEPGLWLLFHLPFFLHHNDIQHGREQLKQWVEKWETPED